MNEEETKYVTPGVTIQEIDYSHYNLDFSNDYITIDKDPGEGKEISQSHTIGETKIIFNKPPIIFEILVDNNSFLILPISGELKTNYLVNMSLLSEEVQELIKKDLFLNKLKEN